jgi:hypothetical protein
MDISPKTWENLTMELENTTRDELPNPEKNQEVEVGQITTEIQPETQKEPVRRMGKKVKIAFVWKILIPITLILSAIFLYLAITMDIIPILQKPKEEALNTPITTNPEPIDPIKVFESEQYMISFAYNSDKHSFSQKSAFSTQPAYFLISAKQNLPQEIADEKDLQDGYFVKISVFEDIERNITDLAERKIEKFKLECPSQREIGDIYPKQIDGLETISFEIKNCDQSFVMNFAVFEDLVFEIAQVYKGDIGFEQNYKAQTEEIISTLKWLRKAQEKPATTVLKNTTYLMEIEHPWLNEECCDVIKPSIEGMKKIAILADSGSTNATKDIEDIVDKLGIFVVPKNLKTFELFINEQKQALIQEYKVVEGKNPTDLEETRVAIGNKEGIKLVNYAWWGTVIYVDHTESDTFVILVIPNETTPEFDNTLTTIFENIKFLDRPTE